MPRTFARPKLGIHHLNHLNNLKFYYSTYIWVYLNNPFITTIQHLLLQFILSISVILQLLSVCSTFIVSLGTVFPKSLPFSSLFFSSIPTDLEPYIVHPWHIKYRQS